MTPFPSRLPQQHHLRDAAGIEAVENRRRELVRR